MPCGSPHGANFIKTLFAKFQDMKVLQKVKMAMLKLLLALIEPIQMMKQMQMIKATTIFQINPLILFILFTLITDNKCSNFPAKQRKLRRL